MLFSKRSIRGVARIGIHLAVGFFLGRGAQAALVNGDFETGDLTGWTLFTTLSGSTGLGGLPAVLLFDTNNDTVASQSAAFNVGAADFLNAGPWGGGIYQVFTSGAGALSLSADIASAAVLGNGSGGLFELLFDNVIVDSLDFGGIGDGATEFGTLSANLVVSAGSHEIRLRITRPFTNSINTPIEYVDNVTASGEAAEAETDVPEPATLLFPVVAASILLVRHRNRYRGNSIIAISSSIKSRAA